MQVVDSRTPGSEGRAGDAVPAWIGAVVGVLALAGGLVVGDLLAALRSGAESPTVDVADRVVDLVPTAVREWAISTFGTSDKTVLLACVLVVLTAVAVLAGVWTVRGRRSQATVVAGVVIVAGALAPLGRGGAGTGSVLSTVVAGVVTLGLLYWLGDQAVRIRAPARPGGQPAVNLVSRRRFFGVAAGVGSVAIVGAGVAAWLRSHAAVAAERLGITLPRAVSPLPPVSAGASVDVAGVSPFITPNAEFYRIDTAFAVPRVSIDDWTVRVHGMVEREISLDFAQLLERPMIELDATIACVSNVVGGDLIGTARWLGCRLDDLLEEAGPDPTADQIVGRSVDGFTAGFPTAVLDGRDAIVAVGMNGEALPTEHGYPARLIVPGLYGYVSATKWLTGIQLTRFVDFQGYWIPRGWDVEGPIRTESRIDTPTDGSSVPADTALVVAGVAWAPVKGISAVEVRVDDGPWKSAALAANHAGTTWRQWRFSFSPGIGEHLVSVRATDSAGTTQTGRESIPGPGPATGWHTVSITAEP